MDCLKSLFQVRHILCQRHPDLVKTHVPILMCKPCAHAFDLFPWNLAMFINKTVCYMRRQFPDLLQRHSQRIPHDVVSIKAQLVLIKVSKRSFYLIALLKHSLNQLLIPRQHHLFLFSACVMDTI